MNIYTIRNNLKNTIKGKEAALAEYNQVLALQSENAGGRMAIAAAAEFLKINLEELNNILRDLEQCRPEWDVYNCPYENTCHRID